MRVPASLGKSGFLARRRRRGQAMVFFILALTLLAFVALWNVDLHRVVGVKVMGQNAGDAAALSAARWQALTLNLVGELNLAQALALGVGDSGAVEAITNVQARLCFAGPMVGLVLAQQTAKLNRIYAEPGFTRRLLEHARQVREVYATPIGARVLFEEPYPGAWLEYADMLEAAAGVGIAAAPDNAAFFTDPVGGHLLLDPAFYEAIAGRNWCWFFFHAPGLLERYHGFRDWPPLPEARRTEFDNSEIFGLGLRPVAARLRAVAPDFERLREAADGAPGPESEALSDAWRSEAGSVWYCYHPGVWSDWGAMASDGPDPFPATGPVRPGYDYSGADAAVRVLAEVDLFMPRGDSAEPRETVVWTAAAKPFGRLDENTPPHAIDLVLPVFENVRLIPLDVSSAPEAGAFDLEWRRHGEEHLPRYLQFGPSPDGCWYCAQLAEWERAAFRNRGSRWLARYSDRCTRPSGGDGGGRRGGGRRRGH